MKRVLCYGDSNTWGYDPATKERYPKSVRWTGVLSKTLGADYEVIEEGLNGRTTVWDDPIEGHKNGSVYLPPCLETHKPLDLVIIMLGTNDLKQRFGLPAVDIAKGAGVLVKIVQKSEAGAGRKAPPVLWIAPPPVAKLTEFADMFEGSEPKSHKLAGHFKTIAAELSCPLLNAGSVIVSSDVDGIHLDPEEHTKLGQAIAAKVKELIG